MSRIKIGVLYSRVRVEEKLLFEAFEKRGVDLDLLDDQKLIFDITDVHNHPYKDYDVIVERCINHSRALYSLKILNDQGVKTVNTALCADICGNKLMTTSALAAAGVPQPKALVAYTAESAIEAIERAMKSADSDEGTVTLTREELEHLRARAFRAKDAAARIGR